jgi:hypothetical protein
MRLSRRAVCLGVVGYAVPSAGHAADRVRATDLWLGGGRFSPLADKMAGRAVSMRGYMAPPLKADARFFVLTRIPMAVCPFCDTEASWPDDLVLVEMDGRLSLVNFNDLIEVTGRLDLGTKTDEETGFVSRVRLADATFSRL